LSDDLSGQPRKRCGKVEKIAGLVAFTASEEAGFTLAFVGMQLEGVLSINVH
jgi:hypothetical protein